MHLPLLSLFVVAAFAACEFNPFEPQTCEACTAKGPRCTFCGDGSCRTQGTLDFLSGDKCCTPNQPCYSSGALNCPSLQLQCTASREYGWANAPGEGETNVIANNQETGEYATINNMVVGRRYQAHSSVSTDFITVRVASGNVVAAGVQPVEFVAQSTSTTLHYHLNSLCEGSNGGTYRISSISALVGGCRATSAYGTQNAPENNGEVLITAAQDPNEFAALGRIISGVSYAVRTEAADRFITITVGTSGGPVVAAGMSPVSWLANASAPHFAHFHVNSQCATTPGGQRSSFLANTRAECTATATYGNIPAPAGGQIAEITPKQAVGEYATITNAGYNAPLRVTSTVATDYVTVRVATPAGRVVAAGPQPVTFTAAFAPATYYIHFHSSSSCDVLDENYRTSRIENLRRECTATVAYGNVVAPAPGQTRTITTKQLPNEYATITSAVLGVVYEFDSRPGDFLTIRMGTASGPTVASGYTPLSYKAEAGGTLFVHYFASNTCGVDEVERVSTVTAFETGCVGTIPYGGADAPVPGRTLTLGAFFMGEHTPIYGATVGGIYSAAATEDRFVTVRSGTFDGPVLSTGLGLTGTFVAQDATFYIHVHLNRECDLDTSTLSSLSVTGHASSDPWAVVSAMFVQTSLRLQKMAVIHPMKSGAAAILGVVAILGLVQSRFPRKSALQSNSVDTTQSTLV